MTFRPLKLTSCRQVIVLPVVWGSAPDWDRTYAWTNTDLSVRQALSAATHGQTLEPAEQHWLQQGQVRLACEMPHKCSQHMHQHERLSWLILMPCKPAVLVLHVLQLNMAVVLLTIVCIKSEIGAS